MAAQWHDLFMSSISPLELSLSLRVTSARNLCFFNRVVDSEIPELATGPKQKGRPGSGDLDRARRGWSEVIDFRDPREKIFADAGVEIRELHDMRRSYRMA
jgi:hypothetical protein